MNVFWSVQQEKDPSLCPCHQSVSLWESCTHSLSPASPQTVHKLSESFSHNASVWVFVPPCRHWCFRLRWKQSNQEERSVPHWDKQTVCTHSQSHCWWVYVNRFKYTVFAVTSVSDEQTFLSSLSSFFWFLRHIFCLK